MRSIATNGARSVVCVSDCLFVCVVHTDVLCKHAAEPTEMPIGRLTLVDSETENHVSDGVEIPYTKGQFGGFVQTI